MRRSLATVLIASGTLRVVVGNNDDKGVDPDAVYLTGIS
jgi:hypothetical protein